MSHRNIELQVGISKITEVTKIQQQLQQQSMNDQADFEQAMKTQTEKKLTSPESPDSSAAVSDQETPSGSARKKQQNKRKKNQSQPPEPPHPYKGKRIDLRG
ncbi:hypothetical protein [Effusibacillus consociatus]|uniref:Uncharacterized protein n=1 Tax=Effusibacillus consociatus TaxID=1117041 RepID=A0ABV9Q4I5_9BACL